MTWNNRNHNPMRWFRNANKYFMAIEILFVDYFKRCIEWPLVNSGKRTIISLYYAISSLSHENAFPKIIEMFENLQRNSLGALRSNVFWIRWMGAIVKIILFNTFCVRWTFEFHLRFYYNGIKAIEWKHKSGHWLTLNWCQNAFQTNQLIELNAMHCNELNQTWFKPEPVHWIDYLLHRYWILEAIYSFVRSFDYFNSLFGYLETIAPMIAALELN